GSLGIAAGAGDMPEGEAGGQPGVGARRQRVRADARRVAEIFALIRRSRHPGDVAQARRPGARLGGVESAVRANRAAFRSAAERVSILTDERLVVAAES